MKEKKYKAWDTVKNKMWSAEELGKDGLTLSPDGRGFVNINGVSQKLSVYMKHLIPLEFTGIEDKNCKDIYEKDRVNYLDESLTKQTGTIEWCDVACGFYAVADNGDDEGNQDAQLHADCDFEVIGNVYEENIKNDMSKM